MEINERMQYNCFAKNIEPHIECPTSFPIFILWYFNNNVLTKSECLIVKCVFICLHMQ